MRNISLFIPGVPVPKGSAKAFCRKGSRHPNVVQTNAEKQRPWASIITLMASKEMGKIGANVYMGPVEVSITFHMPRPKSHYKKSKDKGGGGQLRNDAPSVHTNRPDLDKLIRCVGDALTGVLFKDDSQIVYCCSRKKYTNGDPGIWLKISFL